MWRAFRSVRRHPATALVATLSLAAGIGVNTAVFSLADALFLRPLAVRAPDRLLFASLRTDSGHSDPLSFPEYQDLAHLPAIFESIAAYDERGTTWRAADHLELLLLSAVTNDFFDVLGVRPALGRGFDALRDRDLAARPVVISHSLWVRRLGADSGLVGRAIRLSDRLYTLIGVLPPSFTGLQRGTVTDVYIDLDAWTEFYGSRDSLVNRGARNFTVIGRLAPGVSHAAAASALAQTGERWRSDYPGTNRQRALVGRPADELSGVAGRSNAALLLGIVGLVLIIACANVSMLLVAAGESRRREFAVRLAIGAGRWRIVRQLLAEGAVIAAAGTLSGLLLARWLIAAAPALLPPSDVEMDYRIALDARVLAVTLALGCLAALSSGLLPALAVLRTEVAASLRPSAQERARSRMFTGRTALVVLQVALAVALLNTAGLLATSFHAVQSSWPGFDSRRSLLLLQLSMGDDPTRWDAALGEVRRRVAALPGVRHVTYVRRIPMASYGGGATLTVTRPGATGGAGLETRELRYNQAGPQYLETVGTRLLAGRFFGDADRRPSARVVVVSRTLAQTYFPGEDPLGRVLRIEGEDHEIVGVVEDTRVNVIHEAAEPFLYLPYAVRPSRDVALVVDRDPAQEGLRRVVADVVTRAGGGAAVLSVATMAEHMSAQLYGDWMPALLGAGLAIVGTLLALGGLYAAVAFLATRRTREFGIRMAIGARGRDVLRLVMGQGLALALAGGALGLLFALAAARLVRGFLVGVAPMDPRVLAASIVAAAALGVVASALPAWRATRTDPALTLRYE